MNDVSGDNVVPVSRFWRDDRLPFIEAREVHDGRKVCYAKHFHETFSIGVITGGQSTYLNQTARRRVGPGAVVVMNPGDVHACNPIEDQPWSYRMLYVDTRWLASLQHELGLDANQGYHPFARILTTEPGLYAAFNQLYDVLTAPDAEPLQQQSAAVAFFTQTQQHLNPSASPLRQANARLERAADFISDNCTRPLKLEDVCQAAELSASYLIRAFKKRYGMTPHAYLVNQRIQFARAQLRRGHGIAEVAHEAGFADQAHLQRAFKQLLAATPGQYQAPSKALARTGAGRQRSR
ncbi:AraC family transcriptional regulator [Pyxidicoccus xibeiensis]|uniref:AraC family transcriptional regulator n=1 Tax=Pyxidicoccus xibeiensis TaxID=2906759 RepID=UPI0020A7E958|nr:AraC family transcriptional regulator [Pyxidicoccus xibeiensis]MCP3145177.1 AraC family transcriptional regulator [Pyxidicoccus xibeiensis]